MKKLIQPLKDAFIGNEKAYILYATRWQFSTPIFIAIGIGLSHLPYWEIIVISNAIGATIFFPIDRYIMKRGKQ